MSTFVVFFFVFFSQNLFLLPNVMDDLSLRSVLAKLKINEWRPCGRVLELYPEKKQRQKKQSVSKLRGRGVSLNRIEK